MIFAKYTAFNPIGPSCPSRSGNVQELIPDKKTAQLEYESFAYFDK